MIKQTFLECYQINPSIQFINKSINTKVNYTNHLRSKSRRN